MLAQPDPPVHVDAFMADVCLPIAQPDATTLYLLIDHSGAPGLVSELRRLRSLPWHSLFDASVNDSALEAAPVLVHLPHDGTSAHERALLRWLHAKCATTCCVLAFRSACSEASLVRALQRRMNVVLPQGLPVLLRYFDTRTLSELPAVLSEAQREAFFGVATRWYWLDRYGHAQTFAPQQSSETDTWPDACEFTAAQEAALIDAGAADAVVFQLVQSAPDVVQQHGRLALYRLVQCCLPDMLGYRVESVQMQALYCLAEIEHGPCFDQRARWKPLMEKVQVEQLEFAQAMSELAASPGSCAPSLTATGRQAMSRIQRYCR